MARMDSLGTVDKAVDILFALHQEPDPLGVTALGRQLGMPKASVHRLLASLTRRGLVERDERGRYRPGLALLALGLGVLEREPLCVAARSQLEAEARALDETVFLVALRAGRLVVLDKAEGRGFLRAAPRVGSEVPVHATAVGKLFLAHDADFVLPEARLERFTGQTLTSRAMLDAAVDEVRSRGFAENRDEWIAGLSVVAAPIFLRGAIRGALAVAAPSPRLDELGADRVARRARAAAARIGAALEGGSR